MTTPGGNQGLPAAFSAAVTNLGGLETAVGGRLTPAGAAASMFQTAQSQEVQIVRDDALVGLITGLREDFARWIDMQKTFNDDKSRELDNLREQMRALKQQNQANAVAQASGVRTTGSATAGMTTTENMSKMMPPMAAMNAMGLAFPGMMGAWPQPTNGRGSMNMFPAPVNTPGANPGGGGRAFGGGFGGGGFGGGGFGGPGGSRGGGGGGAFGGPPQGPSHPGNPGNLLPGAGGDGQQVGRAIKMIASGVLTENPLGFAAGIASLGKETYGEVLNQMQKNQRIMEVEGGGNWGAFKERGGTAIDRFRHLSLSGAEYHEMVGLAQSMGYRGSEREAVVTAMNSMKNKLGMSGAESGRYIDQTSRTTKMNLDELARSLQGVSEAARDAHLNAKQMRAQYMADVQSAFSNGAGRVGSTGFADTNSAFRTMMGKGYEDFSLNGASNFRSRAIAASTMGLSPTQLYEMQNRSNSAMAAGMTQDALMGTSLRAVPEPVKQFIMQRADMPMARIKQELMDSGILSANRLDPTILAQIMSNVTGSQVSPDQAVETMIVFYQKNGHPYQSAARDANRAKGRADNPGIAHGKQGKVKDQGHSAVGNITRTLAGLATQGISERLGFQAKSHSAVSAAIRGWQKDHNSTSGVLSAIAQDKTFRDDPTIEFTVHGQEMTMKLSEAIKHYPDIIMTGEFEILTGDAAGSTGAQALGGYVDTSDETKRKAKAEETGSGKVKGKGVKSYKDWEKDNHKHDGKEGGGKSSGGTFTLTPDAAKLLRLIPNSANPGDSTGLPMPLGTGGAGWPVQ